MKQRANNRSDHTNIGTNITPKTPPYVLLFADDRVTISDQEQQTIIVSSFEEAAGYLHILGNTCCPVLSPEYQIAHPGLYEKLTNIESSAKDDETPFNIDTAVELMMKLPLDLNSLLISPIAVKSSDLPPAPIRKDMAHKTNEANVLISEPFSTGWIHYCNIFSDTNELIFDHPSDHVQGMLILEAVRQAGIAVGHLQGLPMDGKIALLSVNTNFYGFLEKETPIILRAISDFTANSSSKDKQIEVFVQLIQWGRICTDAKLKGFAYMNNQKAQKKEVQLGKIAMRNKKTFDDRVNRIIQMELSN